MTRDEKAALIWIPIYLLVCGITIGLCDWMIK